MTVLLKKLKHSLQVDLGNISDDVDEAYEDSEGIYSGERDFGHPQDSFEAGWDRGETVGKYNAISEVLTTIEDLLKEED